MNYSNQLIKDKTISRANIEFYKEFGYLVASGLFKSEEIAELKNDTAKIFKGGYGNVEGQGIRI